MSRLLTSELDSAEIVHAVLQSAIQLVPAADAGTLYLYDPATDKLRPSDSIGFGPSIFNIALDVGEGAAGRAFHLGHGEIHPSVEAIAATLGNASPETLRHFQSASQGVRAPRAAMSAALVFKSTALGALVVDAMQDGPPFGPDDLEFIEDFARIASVAIMNARLFQSEHAGRVRLEVLNAEITRQRDQLDRHLRSVDALLEAARGRPDMTALAHRLAVLTGSRVSVLDVLGRVRAVHPPDDAEDAATRARRDPDYSGLIERVGRDRQRHTATTGGGSHLVASPVTAGPELLGFVVVDTHDRAPDPVDEALVDSAALIASTVFVMERALEEGDVRRRANLLRRLLDGDPPRSATAVRPLEPPLVLAVGRVRPSRAPGRRSAPDAIRALRAVTEEVLRGRLPSGVVDVRDDHVVVACGQADAARVQRLSGQLETVVARFGRDSHDWSARFAVSEPVSDVVLVPQAYAEARLALEIRATDTGAVVDVAGLGAYRLIIGASEAPHVVAFSRRTLAAVLEHDGGLDGKILGTFRTYLAAGASVTAAARKLDVHPHTVQYRLARLEQLTGLSLQRSEDRLTLELAFRIADLAGGRSG